MFVQISSKKCVKSAVIEILSSRWPLSIKALHCIILRQYALAVSYQAVHKVVKQLLEEAIIEKNGRCYCLDRGWISRIKIFWAETEAAYSQQNTIDSEFELFLPSLLPMQNKFR